jgi:hypothetical protein
MSEIEQSSPIERKVFGGVPKRSQQKPVFETARERMRSEATADRAGETPAPVLSPKPPRSFSGLPDRALDIADRPTDIIHAPITPIPPALTSQDDEKETTSSISELPTISLAALKEQFFTEPLRAVNATRAKKAIPPDQKSTLHIHIVKARTLASPDYVLPAEKQELATPAEVHTAVSTRPQRSSKRLSIRSCSASGFAH